MKPERIVDSIPDLAGRFAGRVESAARLAIAERGRFALALPGGSAAEAFLPALRDAAIDWDQVDLFWVDERAVPPEDPESNFGLANRLLLRLLRSGAPRVHRMEAEAADLRAAAGGYERDLEESLGIPPRFDLVLLGVGPDGHVASLFPGHPALAERTRRVIAVEDAPKPPARRMTLTLPAIEGVELICVAAFGNAKAGVLLEAIRLAESPLPVARAVRAAVDAVFFLDPEAASLLAR